MNNKKEKKLGRKKRPALPKRIWRRMRGPLARSEHTIGAVSWFLLQYLRLIYKTNRLVHYDHARAEEILSGGRLPAVFTTWHGQHFIAPFFARDGHPNVAIVSRSNDAELNARVVERLGYDVVRGSGGRERGKSQEKGGARALIALRGYLKQGRSVFMMADIPHGTPRQAGMGIITLAKLSGAPILPIAYASSRRHVFEKAWDKAVLSHPFGRAAVRIGDLIDVPADADDVVMEAKRLELETSLNHITDDAYAIVDGRT